MKYLDLLNQTAEETAKSNNVMIAEEANIAMQSSILACKRQLAEAERMHKESLKRVPFNPEECYKTENTHDLLERKLKSLTNIQKALF